MGMSKQIHELRKEVMLSQSEDGEHLRENFDAIKPGGDRLELVLRHMRLSSLRARQGARRNSFKMAILIEDNM